jgi:hypothetical protein
MAGTHGKAKFLATLQEALDSGRAVAVYADADDYQTYEVGFVEHADTHEVVLRCLTPKGEPDGRRAIRTDDVVRVDLDNSYVRKLELLYQYRETVFDKDFRPLPANMARDLRSQLEFAREEGIVVHLVDANDYGPSGLVREVGHDYVDIERLGPSGEPDGVATMLLASIGKVHMGRRQDQILEFLYRYNHGLRKLLES